MIDIIDKKYGRVVIYEPKDIEGIADSPPEEMEERLMWGFEVVHRDILETASVVGYRDAKKRISIIIKNRYNPLEDYETEQFVLNYRRRVEKLDPIKSRFEILDL